MKKATKAKRRTRARVLTRVVPASEFAAAAILTLDPASKGDCGLCLRSTALMFTAGLKLRAPDWTYNGSVWNDVMHDELGVELVKLVKRGQRVLFASCATAFGPRIALSLGRAIGCVEGLLKDLNVMDSDEHVTEIQDATWRETELPGLRKTIREQVPTDAGRRQRWKSEAIAAVSRAYAIDVTDDAAEAILLNDYVALHRPDLWRCDEDEQLP